MEISQKRANGEWKMENILLIDCIKRAVASRKLNKDQDNNNLVSLPVGYGLDRLTDDTKSMNSEVGIKTQNGDNELKKSRDSQYKEEMEHE